MNDVSLTAQRNPSLKAYLIVGSVLTAFAAMLASITAQSGGPAVQPRELIAPVIALVALTLAVTVLMVLARNIAVMLGRVQAAYYADYRPQLAPAEWIERPARTFNNLMQVPVLFYLACVLMLLTATVDRAQVTLAWVFVATRAAHASIYIGFNHVPSRFTAWLAGCITLAVLWTRFAIAVGVLGALNG